MTILRPRPKHALPCALIVVLAALSACGGSNALDVEGNLPETPAKTLHCAPEPGATSSSVAVNGCDTPGEGRRA